MTDLVEIEHEEYQYVGSLNHSIIQARLARLLPDDNFTIAIELSLDIKQTDVSQFNLKAKEELVPDVCLYPNTIKFHPTDDVSKMQQMPLLSIEIISPRQGIDDIVNKFKAYFALGVKSCWLVIPTLKSISVYSQMNNFNIFETKDDTEVTDKVLDIRVPLKKVFRE
ncbi:MAG: hypothetical protein DRR19_03265 [Candidatus Parabeggiatoa sp. nov. 1]|nr:MAG: hypothetical protein DRR19_03265 [Gammaproteobacteria bacterium]